MHRARPPRRYDAAMPTQTGHDLYFAYGSNLDPVQMRRRCPGSRPLATAVVGGYALTFPIHSGGDWRGGVASIEPDPEQSVEGVVYEVTADDLRALDRYEAVAEGMYVRGRIDARQSDGRTVDAVTYFAVRGYNDPQPPSKKYLAAITRGAEHHGLSDAYVERLRATDTID